MKPAGTEASPRKEKQDFSEPGLGRTAPTQLFFCFCLFVFSWHEWLPDPGSPAPGPPGPLLILRPPTPGRCGQEASLITQQRG